MAPESFQELFWKSSENHSQNLRSVENDMLRIPYARTCYYEGSFAIDGAKPVSAGVDCPYSRRDAVLKQEKCNTFPACSC